MGTYTALHVRTEDSAEVLPFLSDALRQDYGELEQAHASNVPFPPLYGYLFRNSSTAPTMYAAAGFPGGWTVVHFNSFSHVQRLANTVSAHFNQSVIVLVVQTTGCAYYLGLHESGQQRRAVQIDDGEVALWEGTPFEFEKEIVPEAFEEDASYLPFRESELEQYCARWNLPLDAVQDTRRPWAICTLKEPPPLPPPPRRRRSWLNRLLGR